MKQLSNGVICQFSNVRKNVRAYVNKAEKIAKECLFVFGTSSIPGKVGIANLSMLFLSNPRPYKCENLM